MCMYRHTGNTLYLVAVLNQRKGQGQTTWDSMTSDWLFHLDALITSFVKVTLILTPNVSLPLVAFLLLHLFMVNTITVSGFVP